jgi:hypothetical protein
LFERRVSEPSPHSGTLTVVAEKGRPFAEKVLRALAHPFAGVSVALLFGGIVSLARGTDASWDLRNYHFYNPWAWLNDRLYFDYAPAQIQSYLNPLPDLPFYALVRAGTPTPLVSFFMGLPFGLAAYFFVCSARRVILDLHVRRPTLALSVICTIGLTGAAGFSQIGLTMNEWTITALVMAALLLLVNEANTTDAVDVSRSMVAGVLSGAAVGLKLTAAVYALALFLSLLLCLRRRPDFFLGVLRFISGALLGFSVTYGFWGVVLWRRFGSPVFPFYNGVFKSDYWEPRNFVDEHFRPTVLRWLTLPFQLAKRGMVASETYQRDPRLALLVALMLILSIPIAWNWARSRSRVAQQGRLSMPPSVLVLIVFASASYIIWLVIFGVYRYAIPIELVASLLLVLALRAVLEGTRFRDFITGAVIFGIIATTILPDWGRGPLRAGRYIDVRVPSVPPDSLVLMLSGEPFGYIVPFIESHPRTIRPVSNFTGPGHQNRFERELSELLASQRGPMYVIRYLDSSDPKEEQALVSYGLKRLDDHCQPIESNLEGGRRVGICPVVPQGS